MFEKESLADSRNEKEATLSEIRKFLQIEAKNAAYVSQSASIAAHREFEAEVARKINAALADFDRGDYANAISILEETHDVWRRDADAERISFDASPEEYDANANKFAAWISYLKGLRTGN